MSQFMIRRSALKEGSYYIDFMGEYEVKQISGMTKIPGNTIDHIFVQNGGDFDSKNQVYYFSEYGHATDAVKELEEHIKPRNITRSLELTEEEIEYIRRALINEDSNVIFTKNSIRASIFNKLNR